MTEGSDIPNSIHYKMWRRAVAEDRSYFVVSFTKPDGCDPNIFVVIACDAFMEIMSSNKLDDFVPEDIHLECNDGLAFSKDDAKWREKFSDDTLVPGGNLAAFMVDRYKNDDATISFSFFGPRNKVEKFFDPDGDYSHSEIDPEWYCEGHYSGE